MNDESAEVQHLSVREVEANSDRWYELCKPGMRPSWLPDLCAEEVERAVAEAKQAGTDDAVVIPLESEHKPVPFSAPAIEQDSLHRPPGEDNGS
jgi:hypothetical protein